MRRLAIQTRNDTYPSIRDYQQTHIRTSSRLCGQSNNVPTDVAFQFDLSDQNGTPLLCWGGYLAANISCQLTYEIVQRGASVCKKNISLEDRWNRFGEVIYVDAGVPTKFILHIPDNVNVDFWGFSTGIPAEAIGEVGVDLDNSDKGLFPETLYLAHESAIDAEFLPDESDPYVIEDGRSITLKKCAYCSRLLPIDPQRLGLLAFHKHQAKKTKHQNECRACKKWKINDHFNPIRTPDQHHESSTITRERKLLLREPVVLQELKSRFGEGLRSKIWKKFEKKCFRCQDKTVALDEFQLDHTRPLAYLWPIDEFATCLCAECNNQKKEKFPVDFYTEDELLRLSEITGLSLDKLKTKSLNQPELKRVLDDLENFAKRWEPRTFFAVARKIRELEPQNDIEHLLEQRNPELYSRLLFEYNQRPDAVVDGESDDIENELYPEET